MLLYYLDASAWSKRYTGERGWEILDLLLDEVAARGRVQLFSSAISHAESFSALVRFRNRTALPDDQFDGSLKRITADRDKLFWLPVSEAAFQHCTRFILKHNLNATDAAVLWLLLDFRKQLRMAGHRVWLVASDKRFLRAAAAEGLACLDPEASSLREARELMNI